VERLVPGFDDDAGRAMFVPGPERRGQLGALVEGLAEV
jgi:hypothetical protein